MGEEGKRGGEAMEDEGDVSSDTDSDETIIEGSVFESDLEEEELRGHRLFLIGKNMALAEENNITNGIKNINGEKLSPEIRFIFRHKHNDNLQIQKETELINLLHQGSNENEDSPSLLQSGINCLVFPANTSQADCPQVATLHEEYQPLMDSKVDGFQEKADRKLPQRLNNEDSPERSLLSGMDMVEDATTKCTEAPSEVFQSASSKGKDMTDKSPSLETLAFDITADETMAQKFEKDLMEPLSDLETVQMLDIDMLEYQDDVLSVDSFQNEESDALPAELIIALNSLSESVAVSAISHPLEKDFIVEKQLTPEQTDDEYTQITDINLKSPFSSQHLEETEALMVTKMVCPLEEQTDCDKDMHKLICSGQQNITSHDRPAEKGNCTSKDPCSDQVTSCEFSKSAERGKDFTVNHVDHNSSCQAFLEKMNQQICNYEAKTRISTKDLGSNTKEKKQKCSQLRCHLSSSDKNFKVEQGRKSQRIAKKNKQMASMKFPNDASYNCFSPSSINRRDIFGQTLLHRAAMEDDRDSICAVIKAGGDVNIQDHAGWTPLHKSSVAGSFEATNELLKAGADVNCKGSEKVTPLHNAVKEGHYKVAELLLWYGADPLFKNERGKNALDKSTDKHMKKLLEHYIAKSSIRSASAERLAVDPVSGKNRVKKSQSQRKNITMGSNEEGNVRKHSLERTENGHVKESNTFLTSQTQDKEPFQVSSHSNKKQKKAHGQLPHATIARINKRNYKGETRLYLAAEKGDLSLVKSLIASGACVNLKDNAGWTAIHEASNRGFIEIIEELLKAGADVNSKSLDGVLPIHDAVSGNHFEAAQFLLFHGANPNERDICGRSALDEATCDKMKELLKSYGATETKEIPSVSDVVDVRELHPSKSKKIRSCYDCNLVLQSTTDSKKCGKNKSISKVLQDVEENQKRLLLFELRSQKDADVYIQDLSQIQNTLNAILAKQKSERDKLAKKYRASVESFKQGTLREQLVKLVSRQKRLLLMAQKQKELGSKIKNYKMSRKELSSSAKQISKNVLGYCDMNNTKHDTYKTVPCPDLVKTSLVMVQGFLDEEPSQYQEICLNIPVGNREAIGQKESDPQNLVGERMLKEYNIQELVNSKCSSALNQAILPSEPSTSHIQQSHLMEIDSIPVAPQRNKPLNATSRMCTPNGSETRSTGINNNSCQPATESQHVCTNDSLQQHSHINEAFQMQPESTCYLTTQKNHLPKNRLSFTANLEPAGIFSKSKITQTASDSAKQLNFRTNRKEKGQLGDLIEQGKLKPGNDVLEFMLQDSKHKASLLEHGKVKTGNNSVYQNLVQWIKALLGNDITVSWRYVCNKVRYCGTLLSEIIAEVHVPRGPELLLQHKNVPGRSSAEQDYNKGGEHSSFSHDTSSFQDMDNAQQEAASFSQDNGEIPPFPEAEDEEMPSSVCEIKLSSQSAPLKTPRRFLQFNRIVLIQDEEFLPCHTMEQYWDFYTHCENFGFRTTS
ncbi:ankyrin repeat domain-containing protein 31 isoform X2 [Sceloporus undulatus]|uniref:ankyrin repeat domain-containing protein 31 isoform X2 n=1 Tax=Sceloporus undulatus TaxID=8520 RepID=UPI001C4A80D4|nr:ankyrin repeat domain-containing protein 31 isoform X2 [Sceloporus undulatus]